MLYVIDRARIALLLPYCFYYGANQFCVAMYMLFCSFFSFVCPSIGSKLFRSMLIFTD